MNAQNNLNRWSKVGLLVLLTLALLFVINQSVSATPAVLKKPDNELYKMAMQAVEQAKKGNESQWIEALRYLTAYVEREPEALKNSSFSKRVSQSLERIKEYVKTNYSDGMALKSDWRSSAQFRECAGSAGIRYSFSNNTAQPPEPLPPLPASDSFEIKGVLPVFSNPTTYTVVSGDLFFDDFSAPNLNKDFQASLPDARYRYVDDAVAIYQGAPAYFIDKNKSLTYLGLQNQLKDAQRKGWSTSRVFISTGSTPIRLAVRFYTYSQSRDTGIDQLLEIWLIDANDFKRHDRATVFSDDYGANRMFAAGSTISNLGEDQPFAFEDESWYRLVITGSGTQPLRAAIYSDEDLTELVGLNLGHALDAYPNGFRLGISQSVGFPGGTYPTLVAVDWIRLSANPGQ